jgi:glycosyltransferase involved in cell wall biosynthesis
VVVVDDGSTDKTSELVQTYMSIRPALRLIRLHENRGKGAALKLGVRESVGHLLLIVSI